MNTMVRVLSVALLLPAVDAAAADAPRVVMEEFTVPAVDPGIGLYVRNKHPEGVKNFPGEWTGRPRTTSRSCAPGPRSRTSARRWTSS